MQNDFFLLMLFVPATLTSLSLAGAVFIFISFL